MNTETVNSEHVVRKRAELHLVKERRKSGRSLRSITCENEVEDENYSTTTNTQIDRPQKVSNDSQVKAFRPNIKTSTKRVRFRSREPLMKLGKNTVAKYTEQVKHRKIVKRSRRFLYHRSDTVDEPPLLTVQTQEEIIRNLSHSTVKALDQENLSPSSNLQKSFKTILEPLDIHLLTAKTGRITYDLADYIGTEIVGKKVAVKKKTMTSKVNVAQSAALDALREACHATKTPENIIYPRCKIRPYKFRPIKKTLPKPAHRMLRCNGPSQRRLWIINPACARRSEQDQSSSTIQSDRSSVTKKSQEIRLKRKKKRNEFSKLSIEASMYDASIDTTWNVEDGSLNLMLDELETVGEEEIQPEDELLTMLQANVEDDWDVLSQTKQSKKKSYQLAPGSKNPQGQSSFNRVSGGLFNNGDRLGALQSIQLFDTQSMTMGLQNMEGRACIRRLVNLIAAECSTKSIFEKYVQDHRIILDLRHFDLAPNYGPNILQRLKDQMTKIVGQPQVVLNDHSVMEKLKDRIREMYRNQLTDIESNLERKEAERIRALLTRNLIDRDALDAELLRQGELMHAKRRADPAILLQKIPRGQQMVPVFCLNPLKEEYRFCHLENEAELLKQKEFRTKQTSAKSISRVRRMSPSGTFRKKRQKGGRKSSNVTFPINTPAMNTINFEHSSGSQSSEETTVVTSRNKVTHFLPQLSSGLPSLDSCLKSQPEISDLIYDDHVAKLYHAARLALRRGIDAEISLKGFSPKADSKSSIEGVDIRLFGAESMNSSSLTTK